MAQETITTPYLLGRSGTETQRLIYQADFQSLFTRRLLEEAGVGAGMRVLDVGSGAGDVALLAADMVGTAGSVVGVDTNRAVLTVARQRAEAAGLPNVSFLEGDINDGPVDGPFDTVVGRLVLLYQPDPVATLRALLQALKPGGIVAFQEFNFNATSLASFPQTPLWQQVWDWMRAVILRVGLDEYSGFHLYRHFQDAGLPTPRMHSACAVGGGADWGGYMYVAETLRSMMPLLTQFGLATEDEIAIESLAERLRAETIASGGVVKTPDLVGAWARI